MTRTWLRIRTLITVLTILLSGALAFDGKHYGEHHLTTHRALQIQNEPTPLPKECADADLKKLGQPVMVDVCGGGKVLYGFSVGAGQATYGQEIPIYFWLVNASDQPQTVMTCDMDWFRRDGIDVFDARGNRLLGKDEQEYPQYSRSQPTVPFNYSCDTNLIYTLTPHSCNKSERPSNLAESYVLPEGEYAVAPRRTLDCGHPFGKGAPAPIVHPGRLTISIEPKQTASESH